LSENGGLLPAAMILRRLLPPLLVALAPLAHADYDKGMAAMKRGDANTAFKELRAAADRGDVRAYGPLAFHYLRGAGTPRDMTAAREWAAKAGASGDPEGEFALYAVTVSLPELNYVDAQGKVDAARYRALAARPIAGREDEMAAYDALAKAAAQKHPQASMSLAGFLADNVGEGNRARAEQIIDGLAQKPPMFDALRKQLAALDALGPTLATVRIADELQPVVVKTAQAAVAARDKGKAGCAAAKPVRVERLGPVTRPIWLPLAGETMRTAYLMGGTWRERWTVDVCGASTVVLVDFRADGLGSATFEVAAEQ
jgi:TPR repeat protein